MIRLKLSILVRHHYPRGDVSFQVCCVRGHMMSICLITGLVKLNLLVKVASARFLPSKASVFTFVINNLEEILQ